MKVQPLSILFFCLVTVTTYGQQAFVLKGVLLDRENKLRIALVEVTNKRSLAGTGTDDMGFFSIKALVGDTLLFTKRNFSDVEIVIKDGKDLIVYLNRGTTLNEVVITGQSRRQALEEIRREFRAKGSYYDGKPPLKLLNPFGGSPLQFFYELLGKTPAKARRFKRMYDAEIQSAEVDQLFNKTLVNKHTGLKGKALEQFLVSYRPEYGVAKNWTEYDALKWINESYRKYKDTATLLK